MTTRPARLPARGLALALVAAGCAGPRPLDLAIRPADEQAYFDQRDAAGATPREAWYAWVARDTGRSKTDVRAEDAALADRGNPFSAGRDDDAVSRGAVIYRHLCARCHGVQADGRGAEAVITTDAMDFARSGRRFSITLHGGAPGKWFKAIHDGAATTMPGPDGAPFAMPPFADELSNRQIWEVVTYLQSKA